MIRRSAAVSTSLPTMIIRPPASTISILSALLQLGADFRSSGGDVGAGNASGTNAGSGAVRFLDFPSSRRQRNKRLGDSPCRRAISDTVTPL